MPNWTKAIIVMACAATIALAALTIPKRCNRELLSIGFTNHDRVEISKDDQKLLIIGGGFNHDTRVTLECDEIGLIDLEASFNSTGMLEANLSRHSLLRGLEIGLPYSMSVCVHNGDVKECLDKPLSVVVIPEATKSPISTGNPTATPIPIPVSTLTPTPSPVLTATHAPGDPQTPIPTSMTTLTPSPTPFSSPSPSPSSTPSPTPTSIPTFPTSTPTPRPTPTPVVTPTPTRIPGEDSIDLNGGNLSGQNIDPSDPEVIVGPGDVISGTIAITVHNTHGSGTIFPVGATRSWGDPETSYWQVTDSAPPKAGTPYLVSVNLAAPSEPGTYFIVIVGAMEKSMAHVMSATRWYSGIPVWGNGDDVARWSESQIGFVMANDYLIAPCHPESDFKFGAAAVRVRVGS